MSIEADFYNTNAMFKSLEVDSQPGYESNLLLSLVTSSAAVIGSEVSADEARQLLETGVTIAQKKLSDFEMVLDLKVAYDDAIVLAKRKNPISAGILNKLCFTALRRTSGNFFIGIDNCCSKLPQLSELCERFNIRCQDYSRLQLIEQYHIAFDVLWELEKLRPWNEGNHRMARLTMNYLQFMFGIPATVISADDKEAYEQAVAADDVAVFRMMMLEIHIKNLKKAIFAANVN